MATENVKLLATMQDEVGRWVKHNFADATPVHQVLIIAEETGELAHHVLKMAQGIRREEDHEAGVRDAVGDIVIGVMAFCSVWGIDLAEALAETWAEVSKRDWRSERALAKTEEMPDAD